MQLLRRPLSMIAVAVALLPISANADSEMKGMGCAQKAGESYFDPKAIRLDEDGAVLIEYSVNQKGVPERIVVLESTASKSLERSAVRLVAETRCKPGESWQQDGGPQKRLKLNVVFQFKGRTPVSPIEPAEDVITVSTSPIS
jgi:TonB family protein